MDGKGLRVDNVFIERLWRSVKSEYFRFYNDEKPHDALGKCTLSEYHDGVKDAA